LDIAVRKNAAVTLQTLVGKLDNSRQVYFCETLQGALALANGELSGRGYPHTSVLTALQEETLFQRGSMVGLYWEAWWLNWEA
jgi:hypothetical protein